MDIRDIADFPVKTVILTNTPSTGDETVYVAYANPTKQGNLNEVAIQKTVILIDTPSVGDTDITDSWATSTVTANDQLYFNKRWDLRTSYDYKTLSY